MINSTTHNHCNLCDGKNSMEEMILSAMQSNFTDFGMSCHGKCVFDSEYGVQDEKKYIYEVKRLKEIYKNQINITCGIEQDFYAPVKNRKEFDYIIGSVHYLKDFNGIFQAIDGDVETFENLIQSTFNGNAMAMVREFYRVTVENVMTYKPDIIGHFDLVTKNNKDNNLFNENSDEYKEIALKALRECIKADCIFEINTGAMARGYKNNPYPDVFLLEEIKRLGGKVTINSDCHDKNYLTYGFEQVENLLKKIGFKKVSLLIDGKFKEVSI